MIPTDPGAEVVVTATFQSTGTRLEGSFVLEVKNLDGNVSTRPVTVKRNNVPPVVTYQDRTFQGPEASTTPVSILLRFGATSTRIKFEVL